MSVSAFCLGRFNVNNFVFSGFVLGDDEVTRFSLFDFVGFKEEFPVIRSFVDDEGVISFGVIGIKREDGVL